MGRFGKHLTILLIVSGLLVGCTGEMAEELIFRKTLEYLLVEECGEEDLACIASVKSQIKPCMASSDWKTYIDSDNPEDESRFLTAFYQCIVDEDGTPWFEIQ